MEGVKPQVVILYQGRDVSTDFAPILAGVSFKDYLDGRAGETDIQLSNDKGLFVADWYPDVDDEISVMIGYEGRELMHAGTFWVDEVSLAGGSSGDSCTIRALSLRSSHIYSAEVRRVHENRPVAEIVGEVAAEMECAVRGDLSGTWSGLQTDTGLSFLNHLAHDLGRILKVEGRDLILYPVGQLIRIEGVLSIRRSDVLSYDIRDIAAGRISKCTVKWWDRKTKKQITGSYDAKIKGGGTAVRWEEVKNTAEAQKKAKDFITDRNKQGVEFGISLVGDVRLRAGVSVMMTGFGRFDSIYYISEATHSVTSSGYTTAVTLQKPEAKTEKK